MFGVMTSRIDGALVVSPPFAMSPADGGGWRVPDTTSAQVFRAPGWYKLSDRPVVDRPSVDNDREVLLVLYESLAEIKAFWFGCQVVARSGGGGSG